MAPQHKSMKVLGSDNQKWVFLKGYSFIVMCCRIILSISQFWVSLDTVKIFDKLLNLRSDRTYDFSFETLLDPNLDYQWVPIIDSDDKLHEKYGINRLFNLFLVRFLHRLRSNSSDFLYYPAFLIFGFMSILSLMDILQMVNKKYKSGLTAKILTLVRFLIYLSTVTSVILQYFVVMYSNDTMCHMETLYPFLFNAANRVDNTGELLKSGSCVITQRVICCVLVSAAALVPDTFLLVLELLPPLRIYSILVGANIIIGLITLVAVVVAYKFRSYINISKHPKILGYTTGALSSPETATFDAIHIESKLSHFPVYNFKNYINFRITKTLNKIIGDDREKAARLQQYIMSDQRLYDKEQSTAISNFTEEVYIQSDHVLVTFVSIGTYISVITLIYGVMGVITLVKRHKFLMIVSIFVNFVYFLINFINSIMMEFTTHGSRFFCNIKDYTPSVTGITFEMIVLASWICRAGDIFRMCRILSIMLSVISALSLLALLILLR